MRATSPLSSQSPPKQHRDARFARVYRWVLPPSLIRRSGRLQTAWARMISSAQRTRPLPSLPPPNHQQLIAITSPAKSPLIDFSCTPTPCSNADCFCRRSYDLVKKNCNHFSAAFALALGVQHPPYWINRLAWLGSTFPCLDPRFALQLLHPPTQQALEAPPPPQQRPRSHQSASSSQPVYARSLDAPPRLICCVYFQMRSRLVITCTSHVTYTCAPHAHATACLSRVFAAKVIVRRCGA
jgi:hypothetical protein